MGRPQHEQARDEDGATKDQQPQVGLASSEDQQPHYDESDEARLGEDAGIGGRQGQIAEHGGATRTALPHFLRTAMTPSR